MCGVLVCGVLVGWVLVSWVLVGWVLGAGVWGAGVWGGGVWGAGVWGCWCMGCWCMGCWCMGCWCMGCWCMRCWCMGCWCMGCWWPRWDVDEIWDDLAHYMSHPSSEKSTVLLFLSSKSSSFVFESIRLLGPIGVTTPSRADVAFRHVTSRCRHVAMNQVALGGSNRDRTQRCTRYCCFLDWLIIANGIKSFGRRSIGWESVFWW